MKVTIDADSGFCFGVTRAIDTAENELRANENLFCLGDIVHNDMEVDRLRSLGLKIIRQEEFDHMQEGKVLIRAHGEPPETYNTAQHNKVSLIDATCPIVLKLQTRIRSAYSEMVEKNGQIVIYGKQGHAEVRGLAGQTGGNAIIISGEADIEKIDFSRPIRLFSQTTMGTEGFRRIVSLIEERINNIVHNDPADFAWHDTICRQVSNRSAQLEGFVKKFEVVIFVSGKKSSNGLYLYELCRKVNPKTFFISETVELQKEWFRNVGTVGICGATSTPRWLMEEIGEEVKKISI